MVQRNTELLSSMALTRLKELEIALGSVIRGKAEVLRHSLICLLAKGHLLIEDVPGVGKTTLAHALARSLNCAFQRLQCTSDMLPGDILGVTIYNTTAQTFDFKPGPIFTNVLVADEINRATPKTQSALLEAMNERQVTIDGICHPLAPPFMVIATQNPVEHHGAYPLPESQLDRFLMRIKMGYPDPASERQILRNVDSEGADATPVILEKEEVLQLQAQVQRIVMEDAVADYLLAIVQRTRSHESLLLGVSTRGAQALYRAAQASALIQGREYVLPEDVKQLVVPVFAHRLLVNPRVGFATRSTDAAERILKEILTLVDVPL